MAAQRKFAVFDIDGTLIRWQLFHALIDELIRTGYFESEFYEDIYAARADWKRRTHEESFDDYERLLTEKFDATLKGRAVAPFLEAGQKVMDKYKDQVYTYTRNLIRTLKNEGYVLFSISGSPHELVAMLADHYSFDGYAGSTLEERDGIFTGSVDAVRSKRKIEILTQLMAKHNLTAAGSIGVGDSESDIPLLKMVENPIAFNPSKKLFQHARDKGWRVVIERKNMVYELEPQDGTYLLAKTNID
jgi:HAD superfamily hydrolase (TIGR01490 family)